MATEETNTKMLQNVVLVWLDPNISETNDDYQNSIPNLRGVINTIKTYNDNDECANFLVEIEDEKACMIISGSISKYIIPCLHDIPQLDSIFIFWYNKQQYEEWIKNWPKVKGVYADINEICEVLKQSVDDCEQNSIGFTLIENANDVSTNLDRLDPMFMYTQILKEILLEIEFDQQHILDFTQYCREALEKDNKNQLKNVNTFEQDYSKKTKTAIWWYTWESFLYPMLNRALRLSEVELIIKMGFFVADLHRQIEHLHQQQFTGINANKTFLVYRGQGMSKEEFTKISKSEGGLISFNNFLSTSMDKNKAIRFAQRAIRNPALIGVLFVMEVEPQQSTVPFASVADIGAYKQEQEVLFSMHSVFRIHTVKQIHENQRLFTVELALTNNTDRDLQKLTTKIREETFPNTNGWSRLGLVLLQLGMPKQAEYIFRVSLYREAGEQSAREFYQELGLCTETLGESEKALGIQQQSLPSNHPQLAFTYNNIGNVYYSMGEYVKALSSHEKALAIKQQSFPSNHPDLASTYMNIASVYYSMGEYVKALSSYEKALAIQQQSLPSNHPALASTYMNIGLVYSSMGEYVKALPSHEKALAIQQQSLPSNHPNIALTYMSIGLVYSSMSEYVKAFSSHEKALAIQQQSLPSNHPNLASTYGNIGNVYSSMGEYAKALSSHEKALAVQQQSLPSNHPDLALTYMSIGLVYYSMGECVKALSSYEKALAIQQQSLFSNHAQLALTYMSIGLVYSSMGDYAKALSSHEKALAIQQQSLPSNHPQLASTYGNIGNVYSSMGEYVKALSSHEKALAVQQQSLPSNHPDLASTYNNIASVYFSMGEYPKACSSIRYAVDIGSKSLPPNHPDLRRLKANLDKINNRW